MFTIGSAMNGDHGWGMLGTKGFFLAGNGYDTAVIVLFLFMMVFMDTTATIVTGACAERWNFKSFCIFSFFDRHVHVPGLRRLGLGRRLARAARLSSWGLGHGAVDYAGSGVVHMQGGALAFITALMIGPRIGKYDKDGKVNPIMAHNIPMVMLGTFILAFGWFGFNAGALWRASDGRIGIIAVNTMLASVDRRRARDALRLVQDREARPVHDVQRHARRSGGDHVAVRLRRARGPRWSSASSSGVLVVVSCFFFDRVKIDDPVGAISVHGTNGAWGLISVGLFSDGNYGQGWSGVGATDYLGKAGFGVAGLFYGDSKQLVAQFDRGRRLRRVERRGRRADLLRHRQAGR